MITFLCLIGLMAIPGSGDLLEVYPSRVQLAGKRDGVQLVITRRDGDLRRDATSEAQLEIENTAVAKLVGTRVLPVANGQTICVARMGAVVSKVPVVVAGMTEKAVVSFHHEVIPVLTRQGCAGGSCHGSPQGKGGFSLSLFGYDPRVDIESLTRGGLNRRLDPIDPEESLLLKKPLMRLLHVGGKKLSTMDSGYPVMRDWIGAGAPIDAAAPRCVGLIVYPGPALVLSPEEKRQQLSVVARFADGKVKDVTHLAMFETSRREVVEPGSDGVVVAVGRGQGAISVRYLEHHESVHFTVVRTVPGFAWTRPEPLHPVDRLVDAKLRQLQVLPSSICDDSTFLRRASLALTGLIPTADQARSFLTDKAVDRRLRLIDRLLDSDEHARYWSARDADLMRAHPRSMPDGRAAVFSRWLVEARRQDMPLTQIARQLLTASGDADTNPAVNYFLATPVNEELAETTAQLFMGSRINCAKCHNHPFENWTQNDYYRLVAVFNRLNREGTWVDLASTGVTRHPANGRELLPWGTDDAAGVVVPDPREGFATWLTSPGNPFFAKVAVNRAWERLFGRGLVHPVDDFRSSNPPANRELLEFLASELANQGYRLKPILRLMATSEAFARSAATLPFNQEDDILDSHARVRRLSAEQLFDAVRVSTGMVPPPSGLGERRSAIDREMAQVKHRLAADLDEWSSGIASSIKKLPVWGGTWAQSPPYAEKNQNKSHDAVYPPEMASSPGVVWKERDDIRDGKPSKISSVAGSHYLRRTLNSAKDVDCQLVFDKRHMGKVWLDGVLVFDSKKGKPVIDKDRYVVPLQLKTRKAVLLVKLTKGANANPVTFTLRQADGKSVDVPTTASVMELVKNHDGSKESATRLLAARLDADATIMRLRDQARRIDDRSDYASLRLVPEENEFLNAFGQPRRESPCACERSNEPTVDQALQMLNGGLVPPGPGPLARRLAAMKSDADLAGELYLTVLSRYPTAKESLRVERHLREAGQRDHALQDLVWALVNTREFLLVP